MPYQPYLATQLKVTNSQYKAATVELILFYNFKTNNEYNILHSQSYYLRKIKEKQKLSLALGLWATVCYA